MIKYIITLVIILMLLQVSLVYASPASSGWRSEVMIPETEMGLVECCLATDYTGKMHLAMRNNSQMQECCDIIYYYSADTGVSWYEGSLGVSNNPATGKYRRTDIATCNDTIMLAYFKGGQVMFLMSLDRGDSWEDEETVVSNSLPVHPRLGLDGSYIHVIYSDFFASGN